jgi:GntR family transcriptional repressor for pyruvate dehydrogenase complex
MARPGRTRASEIAARLANEIAAGRPPPGGKLPAERELCAAFGVSRSVIRQALASLALSQTVVSRQGAGVFVAAAPQVSPVSDLRSALNAMELRLAIEQEAVALAAVHASQADIAAIRAENEKFYATDPADFAAAARQDVAFHLALANASGNPHFATVLRKFMDDILSDIYLRQRQRQPAQRQALVRRIGKAHDSIIAAIAEGDPSGAKRQLRRHFQQAIRRYRSLLGIRYDDPA